MKIYKTKTEQKVNDFACRMEKGGKKMETSQSLKKEQIEVTKKACKRFELISKDIRIPKLKYLHQSLNFKSNIHYQENKGKIYNYQKYKRGSVVMVNFGTNIGYELSGNHFAIVLNRDDNYKNGLVTVIPLTSKKKTHCLELNDSILDLVLNAQNKYIDMLNETQLLHKTHKEEYQNTFKETEEKINEIKSIMSKDNYLSQYNIKLDKMLDDVTERVNNLQELKKLTNQESKEIEENMDKVFAVLDKYNEKDKISYAMVRNITTISKLKILKPINKYDPIGTIRISNDSLDKIDAEIDKLFTGLGR